MSLMAACSRPATAPGPESDSGTDAFAREAAREYADADYYKPADDTTPDESRRMAPLLLLERLPDRSPDRLAGREASGDSSAPNDPPVVYEGRSVALLRAGAMQQLTHVWRVQRPDAPPRETWRGVRVTLDSRGRPAIWEVLDERRPALLFVSRSLEDAAAETHGRPLSRQRFSIERDRSSTLVVRVLDDGPEPMGPWVYLAAETSHIGTVLCRCMPSQFSNASQTYWYRLAPLEELLAARGIDRPTALTGTDPSRDEPSWLERALRLPPRF